MVVQAVLITLVALLCHIDSVTTQLSLFSPLFAGSVVGLVLGDFKMGMILAAELQLYWLGVMMIGAYVPPDIITGTILGVAFAIFSKQNIETAMTTALAVSLPVGLIMQQMGVLRLTLNIPIMHKADKDALTGDFDKTANNHLLGLLTIVLTVGVPVFLAVIAGWDLVATVFSYIPEFILKGLAVAGGFLPALGFGMLLMMMMDKGMWIFYLLGFAITVYLKVPTMGVAIFALILAVLYDVFTNTGVQPLDNRDRRDL